MDAATLPDLDQLDSNALKSLILALHEQVFSLLRLLAKAGCSNEQYGGYPFHSGLTISFLWLDCLFIGPKYIMLNKYRQVKHCRSAGPSRYGQTWLICSGGRSLEAVERVGSF